MPPLVPPCEIVENQVEQLLPFTLGWRVASPAGPDGSGSNLRQAPCPSRSPANHGHDQRRSADRTVRLRWRHRRIRIEQGAMERHQLINHRSMVGKTLLQTRHQVDGGHAIEQGVADLAVIVSRAIGNAVHLGNALYSASEMRRGTL